MLDVFPIPGITIVTLRPAPAQPLDIHDLCSCPSAGASP